MLLSLLAKYLYPVCVGKYILISVFFAIFTVRLFHFSLPAALTSATITRIRTASSRSQIEKTEDLVEVVAHRCRKYKFQRKRGRHFPSSNSSYKYQANSYMFSGPNNHCESMKQALATFLPL